MNRMFAAIKIRPEKNLVTVMENAQKACKDSNIKWVDPHNLHITLRFFGDVAEDRIKDIKVALQRAARSRDPFDFYIQYMGYFGPVKAPRVLWLGITEPKYNNLEKLFLALQKELLPFGFKEKGLFFRPHLTIGRIKRLTDVQAFHNYSNTFPSFPLQKVHVRSFQLFESKLKPDGPVYHIEESFNLKK